MKNKKTFTGITRINGMDAVVTRAHVLKSTWTLILITFLITACASMTIAEVEWNTLEGPEKARQFLGISNSEVKVFALYQNGDRRQTSAGSLRYDKDIAGPQTVIVRIGGVAGGSFETEVMELIDIRVERLPSKTSYTAGDQAVLSGIRVMGTWEGMPDAEIPASQLRVAGFDSGIEGGTEITVSFNGMYASFPVTVTVRPDATPGTYSVTSNAAALRESEDDIQQERGEVVIVIRDDELAALLRETPNPNRTVGPLIQTKWNQRVPFSNLYPMVNGQSSICGCVNLAWAQLMKFHQHPARGKGESASIVAVLQGDTLNVPIPSVNFNIAYDWNNMLNSYRSDGGDSNERQRNAVATLVQHIGAARGSYNLNIPEAMTNVFGYDRSIQYLQRRFYTDAEWESIIRRQLDAGLPVFMWGRDPASIHGFIIDGYDNQGRFHVNWGWGGRDDGWYSLGNLNPPAMSSPRSFYNDQYIIINFKPDQGSTGSHEMGLESFTVSKATAAQNELLTVTANVRSFGYFPGGQVGVALVNTGGTNTTQSVAAVIGTANYASRNPNQSRTITMNCIVPDTVRPGQYSLRIVTREEGGQWKIVSVSDRNAGVPNVIPVTVTSGLANGGGYGLALTAFSASAAGIRQYEIFTVTATPRNVGPEQFPGGQVGAALTDNNGGIVAVIGTANRSALNSGSLGAAFTINCFVPETVRAGQYRLMIVVRPTGGEWRLATLAMPDIPTSINFTVTAGLPNSGGYGLAFSSLDADEGIVSASPGARFNLNYNIRNPSAESFEGSLRAVLIDNAGNETVIGTRASTSFAAGSGRASSVTCTIPNTIAPGNYQLKIAVRPADGEWRTVTMFFPNVPNSIGFTVR